MGEIKLFQICYEGELTVGVSHAMRRLGAEPNFDQSWNVWLPEGGHAALAGALPADRSRRRRARAGRLLAVHHHARLPARSATASRPAPTTASCTTRIDRLGIVVELPFESTFVVQSDDRTDVNTLGLALGELCPDDALMVTGISHDWAYCDGTTSRMYVAEQEPKSIQFRTF